VTGTPTPPPPAAPQSPWQISPDWIANAPVRKEYREERESEMAALLESHQAAEKAAVDFAQTVIRSGFVVNAGAIIAIPAIIALFNLDAEAIRGRLLVTGIFFAAGICAAWLAGIFAFFTLAHKSDHFNELAVQTARYLQGKYFPPQASELMKQASNAEKRARRLLRLWRIARYIAIVLSLTSVALFLCGSWFGVHAALKAPHKIPMTEQAVQTSTPAQRAQTQKP
jgi:MFS family permease